MHYSEWSEERKEKSRQSTRDWIARNPGVRKDEWAEYYKNQTPEYTLLKPAKDRAKKGGYECTITVDDIDIPKNCPICNVEMKRSSKRGGSSTSPTLDKVHPQLGYVPGNVAVICKMCNSVKHSASAELHRQIADYIDTFPR